MKAKTFEGGMFGLGAVHAKDRLWQLNFYKHLAQGRLSEILGPDCIEIDRYIRMLGVPRATKEHMKKISEEDLNEGLDRLERVLAREL